MKVEKVFVKNYSSRDSGLKCRLRPRLSVTEQYTPVHWTSKVVVLLYDPLLKEK